MAARSETWVCGRLFAGIAGSNPAGDIDVCFECCVSSSRSLCDGPITRPGILPSVMCLSVIE